MFFINESYINSLIEDNSLKNENLQKDILKKGQEAKGLTLKESAALLNISSPDLYDELFHAAKKVKESIFGKRMVLFAPLYLSNICVNNCLYCAFRNANNQLKTKILSLREIEEEARNLLNAGHKRILLVAGKHPQKTAVDFMCEAVERISPINIRGNHISRINVNSAPLSVKEFKQLKTCGIGTYIYFQETYRYSTYQFMHSEDPKEDYAWRLYTMDRALQSGIDDVGIGALFGLTDYRFETLALLSHAFDIDLKYGIGPHTISIPRLEPALNLPAALSPPYSVDDLSFKKLVSVIRLAVPYTGLILSTRERPELRKELFEVGISQISTGSRPSQTGSRESRKSLSKSDLQFQTGDHRSLDEVVKDLTAAGHIPSFCTACFRKGRTGNCFMEHARTGNIANFCTTNAYVSFREYLNDFASEETNNSGSKFLESELEKLNGITREKITGMVEKVFAGEKDVYI